MVRFDWTTRLAGVCRGRCELRQEDALPIEMAPFHLLALPLVLSSARSLMHRFLRRLQSYLGLIGITHINFHMAS